MSDRPEQSQVRMVETALPFSTPPSDKMLSRITILLFILVAGLLTVFGYYASSICITVILAGFLAILFDPVIVILEKCICRAVSPRPALCSQA
jgi:predicted PurR-regulated permease PerM